MAVSQSNFWYISNLRQYIWPSVYPTSDIFQTWGNTQGHKSIQLLIYFKPEAIHRAISLSNFWYISNLRQYTGPSVNPTSDIFQTWGNTQGHQSIQLMIYFKPEAIHRAISLSNFWYISNLRQYRGKKSTKPHPYFRSKAIQWRWIIQTPGIFQIWGNRESVIQYHGIWQSWGSKVWTSINSDFPHTSQHMFQMWALQDAETSVNLQYATNFLGHNEGK